MQLAVEHVRLHLAGENRLARQSDRHTGAIKNLVDPLFYGRNFFDYLLGRRERYSRGDPGFAVVRGSPWSQLFVTAQLAQQFGGQESGLRQIEAAFARVPGNSCGFLDQVCE